MQLEGVFGALQPIGYTLPELGRIMARLATHCIEKTVIGPTRRENDVGAIRIGIVAFFPIFRGGVIYRNRRTFVLTYWQVR